jgi:hypothetical protein
MKTTIQQLTSTLALAGLALLNADANAATISWQASVDMYQGSTVETFVNTDGTTAVAMNASGDTSGDEDTTVNGVAFTGAGNGVVVGGSGTETITINGGSDNVGSFGDGEFSSNGAIYHLIRGAIFEVDSVTLGGLQVGQEYLIQIFTNDARSSRSVSSVVGFDGAAASPLGTSQLNNSADGTNSETDTGNEAGDSILATFTADSVTQSFDVFGSGNGGASFAQGAGQAQINAIQLRSIPEPGSLALLGLGGLLIARRRRG